MTDMSVANHMASQTTLQQEQGSGPVFTPEQQANLTPADVAALDPQRARDGMSEMYSIVFRQAGATVAASRDRARAERSRDRGRKAHRCQDRPAQAGQRRPR